MNSIPVYSGCVEVDEDVKKTILRFRDYGYSIEQISSLFLIPVEKVNGCVNPVSLNNLEKHERN